MSELPIDSVIEVAVGDNFYALCNDHGTIRALSGVCAHQGGPLGQGQIANGRLMCPWHAWEFDCRTGENCDDPGARVATYEVRLEGNEILLQVP